MKASKVKVPVLGTIGKAVFVDPKATQGATIGSDLRLPDGSVPTLEQLARALGVSPLASDANNGLANTLWRLVREIPNSPYSVIGTAGATSGIPQAIAAGDNDTILRRVDDAVGFGKLTLEMAPDKLWTYAKLQDASALSILGRGANTDGVLADITASADKAVLHRDGDALAFSTIDHTYVSDFDEAAQDAVGGILANSADIEFTYDDAENEITAVLSSAVHSSLELADSAVQPGDLAAVAFSGDYGDLINTPSIPPDLSGLTFITSGDETSSVPNSLRLIAGTNITFDVSTPSQLVINAVGGGGVESVVDGFGILVDDTDPANPIISVDENFEFEWTKAHWYRKYGELMGFIPVNDTTNRAQYMMWYRADGATARTFMGFGSDGNDDFSIWNYQNSAIRFVTNNGQRMLISGDGLVSITNRFTSAGGRITHTTVAPAPGQGMEFDYLDGDRGRILTYNRDTATYLPLLLEARVVNFAMKNVLKAQFDSGDEVLRLISNTATGGVYVAFYESNATDTRKAYLGFGSGDNDIFSIANEENSHIDFRTGGALVMRIDSRGVVWIRDGITAPGASITGMAGLYIDSADGDLKIRFADGTVKTIVTDT